MKDLIDIIKADPIKILEYLKNDLSFVFTWIILLVVYFVWTKDWVILTILFIILLPLINRINKFVSEGKERKSIIAFYSGLPKGVIDLLDKFISINDDTITISERDYSPSDIDPLIKARLNIWEDFLEETEYWPAYILIIDNKTLKDYRIYKELKGKL